MIDLRLGDCLEVMATMPANSVDTILTDPPYGLTFMGKDWDRGVPGVAFWREALRVAKPGATLLAMGGTRTFHRLVCAIEDAGWEVRDSMAWLYGSGFPKSYDISKGIDKQAGAERIAELVPTKQGNTKRDRGVTYATESHAGFRDISSPATPAAQLWHGWGTALKPAMELICVAMKPIDGTFVNNALTWGVAGFWIDGGRVGSEGGETHAGGWQNVMVGGRVTNGGVEANHTAKGRFPANVIHDGSDEVTGLFPQRNGEMHNKMSSGNSMFLPDSEGAKRGYSIKDSGSAARFFYCAKASRSERNAGLEGMEERRKAGAEFRPNHTEKALNGESGNPYGRWDKIQNHHPTVKPLALMRYLCRLTKTPTGGVVLDPFMGSGTTGCAAVLEGRDFIGIELNEEYMEIAKRRIAGAQMQPKLEAL